MLSFQLEKELNSIKFKEIVEMTFVLLKTKQGKLKQSTGVH